jgi:hypothetical protein
MRKMKDVLKYWWELLIIFLGVSLVYLLAFIFINEQMLSSFLGFLLLIEATLMPTIYFVGLVVVCGFAIICVILKNSVQAVDPEGSLKQGFRSLGIYIYFGFFEIFKELFSKKTLKGFLWLIGLCILVGGFGGLMYLLFSIL